MCIRDRRKIRPNVDFPQATGPVIPMISPGEAWNVRSLKRDKLRIGVITAALAMMIAGGVLTWQQDARNGKACLLYTS